MEMLNGQRPGLSGGQACHFKSAAKQSSWTSNGCTRTSKKARLNPPQAATSMSRQQMSSQFSQMRRDMEQNEQIGSLMDGLRGKNIDDSDFADESVVMRLVNVDVDESDPDDALPLTYSPELINGYWGRRPVAVTSRILQLLGISWSFLSKLGWDFLRGQLSKTEVARARELRNIVTSLGPAYIKLGQALSIRPDILSPAAMVELQKLCDKVPSFPDKIAMDVIQAELGAPWQQLYDELSPRPIAAASLGQVYKGKLRTGEEVAVKVQRPLVLETVTVDLYVIRRIGLFLRRFPSIGTDVVALLDEWAVHFFEELDYVHEGNNGTLFAESIRRDLPQVVVPKTFNELTSRRVLTTSWLEGEKLSQSKASDIKQLVNLGVVCYLKQLLDTGFFHGDPHPGNMMRTPDGRLAILDFGLMTQIDSNIKYGMIEAISHLIHRDYEAIVEDFVTLDFIPRGTNLRPILPVLAQVFDQALAGGGAKSINFQDLAADLAQITFDYPFRIPPYFALIIRAISVLEGVALVGDPNFAIVDEAYPYIAKRLLTDDSPRLQEALRYMIYGKNEVFDVEKLIDLLSAFESFSEASQSARGVMGGAEFVVPTGNNTNGFSQNRVGNFFNQGQSQNGSRTQNGSSTQNPQMTSINVPVPFGWMLGIPPEGVAVMVPTFAAQQATSSGYSTFTQQQNTNFSQPQNANRTFNGRPTPAQEGVARYTPGSAMPSTSTQGTTAAPAPDNVAREALKFVLSPSGTFFRDFLMTELVQSFDALSRKQLLILVQRLRVDQLYLPVLLPNFRIVSMQMSPVVTKNDELAVQNVTQLINFLTGGTGTLSLGSLTPSLARELAPLLPTFALSFVPELGQRLISRLIARSVREGVLARNGPSQTTPQALPAGS